MILLVLTCNIQRCTETTYTSNSITSHAVVLAIIRQRYTRDHEFSSAADGDTVPCMHGSAFFSVPHYCRGWLSRSAALQGCRSCRRDDDAGRLCRKLRGRVGICTKKDRCIIALHRMGGGAGQSAVFQVVYNTTLGVNNTTRFAILQHGNCLYVTTS